MSDPGAKQAGDHRGPCAGEADDAHRSAAHHLRGATGCVATDCLPGHPVRQWPPPQGAHKAVLTAFLNAVNVTRSDVQPLVQSCSFLHCTLPHIAWLGCHATVGKFLVSKHKDSLASSGTLQKCHQCSSTTYVTKTGLLPCKHSMSVCVMWAADSRTALFQCNSALVGNDQA